MRTQRHGWVGCIAFCLASPAWTGGVRILDAAGDRNYAEIQAAVDAAVDGDILLLGQGTYGSFVIDGKELTLLSAPSALVRIQGSVEVRNLTDRNVVLAGLTVEPQVQVPGLRLVNNVGIVRIQECVITSGRVTDAAPAVSITACSAVTFVSCTLRGLDGLSDLQVFHSGGDGGHAVHATGSSVQLVECTLLGGAGGEGEDRGGDGGNGYRAKDAWVSATGCEIRGGNGGIGYYSGYGASAAGIRLEQNAQAEWMDSIVAGGAGAPASSAPFGGLTQYAGLARRFALPRIVSDQSPLALSVQGFPGDRVFLTLTPGFVFQPLPGTTGVWAISFPILMPFLPKGTIPASGATSVRIALPALPAGTAGERTTLQSLVDSSSNQVFLSGPLQLLRLGRDSGPDCNGNGISDYVDVIEGLVPDLDHDLIPDSCQWAGPDWYVDAAAAPGGNGSPSQPFQTVGHALGYAQSGDTVNVADGIYTGSANRNLSFAGRSIVLRSTNGPASCIIDCQGLGRAFEFTSGETAAARVQGFTIRNGNSQGGSATTNRDWGGGILAWHSSPTIEGCVIESCTARQAGGGIAMWYGNSVVRNCSIRSNAVAGDSQKGGGGVFAFGFAKIVGCLIEGNTSVGSGGGVDLSPNTVSLLSHSIIRNNSASKGGGGVYGYGSLLLRIDHCAIAGNAGSGIVCSQTKEIQISNSVIVDHSLSGAALYFSGHPPSGSSIPAQVHVTLVNSIAWGNSASSGTSIGLFGANTQLTVSHSIVEDGPASITLASKATLVWGQGNLTTDPLLTPSYHPRAGSPAIDSGDTLALAPDWGDVDLDGIIIEPVSLDLAFLPRLQDDPTVPDTGNGVPPTLDRGCYERQP